jgi:outer membrane receptor protein involved in Fe transport
LRVTGSLAHRRRVHFPDRPEDASAVPAPPVKPLAVALALGFAGPCAALQSEGDLLDLELEALLEVSVASARAEALRDTPVVVSRIDAAEARRYGLRSLAEWLSLLPGVLVQDTAIGTEAVMVRGLVEGFNQKVLFLLDGVPYWQSSHGDVPLAAIPLELVQHVELVRGPGGILFGTNATGGVINVVTRRDADRRIAVAAGSQQRWRGEGYWHHDFERAGGLSLALSANEGPDYDGDFTRRPVPANFPPGTPSDGEVPRGKQQVSAFIAWRGEHGSLRWHGFETGSEGLAAAASLLNTSRLQYEGQQLVAERRQAFGEAHQLQAIVDWTRYTLSIPTDRQLAGVTDGLQTFAEDGDDNQRLRGGLHWQSTLGEERYLQAGVERELRRNGEYQLRNRATGALLAVQMTPGTTGESALYLQGDARFGDWRAVLGLRRVDSDVFDDATLPRGSLLWQVSERQNWRLVYAEGYNAPTPLQRRVQVPPNALRGNPDLLAESVRNLELAWTWQNAGQSWSLTGYRLQVDEAIRRALIPGTTTVTFVNLPPFRRHGLEAEWRIKRERWQTYASAHWLHEGNSDADAFALLAPRWQASAGASWTRGAHQWGASLRHIGRRAAADGLWLANLHYRYEHDDWYLEAGIDNLFGDDQQHADALDLNPARLVAAGPADPGVVLGMGWRF